jgi:hypothetical protein
MIDNITPRPMNEYPQQTVITEYDSKDNKNHSNSYNSIFLILPLLPNQKKVLISCNAQAATERLTRPIRAQTSGRTRRNRTAEPILAEHHASTFRAIQ